MENRLFDIDIQPSYKAKKRTGGSQNSDVFYNYDAYIAKFQNKNHVKTTDDTYTPDDVFNAVVKYRE